MHIIAAVAAEAAVETKWNVVFMQNIYNKMLYADHVVTLCSVFFFLYSSLVFNFGTDLEDLLILVRSNQITAEALICRTLFRLIGTYVFTAFAVLRRLCHWSIC